MRAGRIGFAAIIALVTTGCAALGSQENSAAVDGPTYDTVAALAAEADLVARATPIEIVDKGEDCGGGDPSDDGQCSPYVVWALSVDEVLAGEAPARIDVVWEDPEGISTVASAPLAAKEPLILFLHRVDPSKHTAFDDHYVPFHSDQGVFDVAGEIATARSEIVRGLTSPKAGSGFLTVPVADLESTVAAASTEG